MAVTMKEIARLAGVTRPVVSAVLNGSRTVKVSQAKREQILGLIKNLGYKPNISAMVLNGKPTKTIGCLLSNFHLPADQGFILRLGLALAANDYQLHLLPLINPQKMESVISDFIQSGIDGLLYQGSFRVEIQQDRYSIPMLAFAQSDSGYEIAVDAEQGSRLLIEHLKGHGHKNIAFIGNSLKVQQFKVDAYCNAIRDNRLDYKKDWIINLTWNPDFAEQIKTLIKKEKVTAFATSCDFIAVNLITYLENIGIRVPGDIAVVGFDGDNYANSSTCRLTTIIQPVHEFARKSVELLMEKIANKKCGMNSRPVLIKPTLHIGDSCGCTVPKNKFICWEGIPPTIDNVNDFIRPPPEDKA